MGDERYDQLLMIVVFSGASTSTLLEGILAFGIQRLPRPDSDCMRLATTATYGSAIRSTRQPIIMHRSLASASHNSKSASPLAKAAADSDDTESLISELSKVSISETSEKSISALAKTSRRDSARAPFDGQEKVQSGSRTDKSNAIRGGCLVKQRPDGHGSTESTHSITETPEWRRINAGTSAAVVPPSRNDGPLESSLSAPCRPGSRRRVAQNVKKLQRYETRSHPSAASGNDTRWQGSREPNANFPFRDGSVRKSEPPLNDHKISQSIRQERSTKNAHFRRADVVTPAPTKSAYRNTSLSTKFKPITRSSKTPVHLEHPFRLLPTGTTFDIRQALHSEQVTERHPSPEYFALASKSPNAYYGNDLETDPTQSRKLLILDLNGAMLVRSKRSSNSAANTRRRVYLRPFLDSFLNFIFAPARAASSESGSVEQDLQEMRPYEAFVWSSAQPVNVDSMIRSAFGKWAIPASPDPQERVECEEWISRIERAENRPGRILGVWTRDAMDLTRQQYGRKSTTYKDLNKVFNHFRTFAPTSAERSRFYHPDPDFTPSTKSTLLIDDSTIKACMQPYNHIPIPEFDLECLRRGDVVSQNVKRGVKGEIGENGASDIYDDTIREKARLLRLVFGHSASDFFSLHANSEPLASSLSKEPPTLDGILLGVIGILSEVQDVVNLPAWIAAGGLLPDVKHTFTQDMSSRGWDNVVLVDSKSAEVNSGNSDAGMSASLRHQVPTLLPSHPDYTHWYRSPLHLLYWVRRGLVALDERGIEAR
ncbi:hypothetical protein QFC22_000613 [Naganishia vaughanmartiniae]|uniref:Uncharacterized protein n=1 Tax=Naganishia vaughanmartiniae TaxID=1424756 RepID=A0ACC2XRL3_9TREE|nr:hypothetical protein QFC22_000613 [Naganishia vaughanmartiniae]